MAQKPQCDNYAQSCQEGACATPASDKERTGKPDVAAFFRALAEQDLNSIPGEAPLRRQLVEAVAVLERFLDGVKPVCGLVLGSGLNFYAETLDDVRFLPYSEVPHMRVSSAEGHAGRFVLGWLAGNATDRIPVLCMQGRIHGYEGANAWQVAYPVWLMAACGIDVLVATNAAGSLNPNFAVGSFCVMEDHINLTGRNPVAGMEPHAMAQRFVPMYQAYDPALRELMHDSAACSKVDVHEGVYLGLLGPSFETPAEIRAFRALGADTVAMSVVEEVIAARHVGMRVLGMSLVSNMACGIDGASPESGEVMQVALSVELRFKRLMDGFVRRLADELA